MNKFSNDLLVDAPGGKYIYHAGHVIHTCIRSLDSSAKLFIGFKVIFSDDNYVNIYSRLGGSNKG